MATKIILTVKSKLQAKYGKDFPALEKLFQNLITSDKPKGLDTELIYIDDPATVAQYNLPVLVGASEKDFKDIFDHLFTSRTPDYAVIFGAQDVFPFQQLVNLAYKPGGDDDQNIPSDLPYACDARYSTNCNSFTNPSRVVGRIPDLPNSGDIGYVRKIFGFIVQSKPKPSSKYDNYLAVSASVWLASTKESITNIFGNSSKMLSAPPALAGHYTTAQLGALSHFFNCHGALNTTSYYGQSGSTYPESLKAIDLNGRLTSGTVVAAECCYGAQLLEVSRFGISIANNYLFNSAISFMGASTIAYGPASGQGLADLICQYFLINVRQGASCGRALLDARQKFLSVSGPTLDPYELKTLAQFYILGDPSVQPVVTPPTKDFMDTITDRRLNLQLKGINLGLTTSNTRKVEEPSLDETPTFRDILKGTEFGNIRDKMVFEVEEPVLGIGIQSKALYADQSVPNFTGLRYHVYQKRQKAKGGVLAIKVLVIKESNQQVLGWKQYESR
jgi:hypothetical protein